MKLAIAIIDAFTDRVFHGNPAATTLVAEFPEDAQMQQVAAEINLSETAFVKPIGNNHFQLRWFTPVQEVPLCGHATLAMAHYLREISAIATDIPLIFSTLSGDLRITYEDDLIVMDFPAASYRNCSERSLQILNNIFGELPYGCLGLSEDYLAVVLESEFAVQNFQPNYELISQLESFGFIITAIANADQPYDFVSRFFAPKAGIPEDPVTGSAHCSLTPYWAKRFGKTDLKAKQLSARTGELTVCDRVKRVLLKGKAVTFMYGQVSY